jgi:hypothetical protein
MKAVPPPACWPRLVSHPHHTHAGRKKTGRLYIYEPPRWTRTDLPSVQCARGGGPKTPLRTSVPPCRPDRVASGPPTRLALAQKANPNPIHSLLSLASCILSEQQQLGVSCALYIVLDTPGPTPRPGRVGSAGVWSWWLVVGVGASCCLQSAVQTRRVFPGSPDRLCAV